MNINKVLKYLVYGIIGLLLLGTAFLFVVGGQTCFTRGFQKMRTEGSLVQAWDTYNRCQMTGGLQE